MAPHDAHQDDPRTHLNTSLEEIPDRSPNLEEANTLASDETPLSETILKTADSELPPSAETLPPEAPAALPPEPSEPGAEIVSSEVLSPEPGIEVVSSEMPSPETPVDAASDENLAASDETLPSVQQSDTEAEPSAQTTPSQADDPASLAPTHPVPPVPPTRPKRLDRTAVLALCAALILLLLGSSGLIFDLTYYHPNQVALGATMTANAQATSTASSYFAQTTGVAATATANEQPTVQVYRDIYQSITSGKPLLSDSLNHQSNTDWDEYSDKGQDFCGFRNGSYHDEEIAPGYFNPCTEGGKGLENFAIQVDMTIVSGDYGGVLFRGHDGFFYFFDIDLSGEYAFNIWNYKTSSVSQRLDYGNTTYMQSDSTQANTITLIAEGSTFYIYINGHFIETVTDSSYQSGWFGLIADSGQDDTDVAFSNLKVWQL